MLVVYDAEANAAYLHLVEALEEPVSFTVTATDDINLDFDAAGVLLGIEVLDASEHLPRELLKEASSAAEEKDVDLLVS